MKNRANLTPTLEEMKALAWKTTRRRLNGEEAETLCRGIERLADIDLQIDKPDIQWVVRERDSDECTRLLKMLDTATRLYARCYGLTMQQAISDVKGVCGKR
jgi:hypothetical protein